MVWSEDRIPDRGRDELAEASVGVGVHGPEVEVPFGRRMADRLLARVGKCCEPAYSGEEKWQVPANRSRQF